MASAWFLQPTWLASRAVAKNSSSVGAGKCELPFNPVKIDLKGKNRDGSLFLGASFEEGANPCWTTTFQTPSFWLAMWGFPTKPQQAKM